MSGLITWVAARNGSHIGASAWIFGLWSLCLATAYFDRSFKNIAIAMIVIFLYGSFVLGMLPLHQGVSFEGHIAGTVAGIICAYFNFVQNRKITVRGKS